MKKILVLHGLGSGANNGTSKALRELLDNNYDILAPEIPHNPDLAIPFLKKLYKEYKPDIIIGNSLGGFYTMCLDVDSNTKKILINPAMIAYIDIEEAIGYGEYEFTKVRLNEEKNYIVDKLFCDKLYRLTMEFQNKENKIKPDMVIGFFGEKDEHFHHQLHFRRVYPNSKNYLIPNAHHRLTFEEVKRYILPEILNF